MCWLFLEASDLAPAEGQAYRSMHYAPAKDAYSVKRCVNETLRLYGVCCRTVFQAVDDLLTFAIVSLGK